MPIKLHWTEATDARIRRLRAEGASWDSIAASLGVSRWSAIERGRLVGAQAPPKPPAPPADLAREPLPAGHPISWGLLTAGTLLDGTAYPWPPMDTGA